MIEDWIDSAAVAVRSERSNKEQMTREGEPTWK
jgi:hypothetical protein